jgi:hypothetical protein
MRRTTAGPHPAAGCPAATPTGVVRRGCRKTIRPLGRCKNFTATYGDDFKIERPSGAREFMTINAGCRGPARRLARRLRKDADGQRPVLKYHPKLAGNRRMEDYVLSHAYFNGDFGREAGASRRTGCPGPVADFVVPEEGQFQPDEP